MRLGGETRPYRDSLMNKPGEALAVLLMVGARFPDPRFPDPLRSSRWHHGLYMNQINPKRNKLNTPGNAHPTGLWR
jgi:hypothetical protein